MLDYESKEAGHPGIKCDVTNEAVSGPIRYHSLSKINGDYQQIDISEKAFMQSNIYDINPLVYYRLSKPLKEGAALPELDSLCFYKESADYGLDFEV